MSHSTSRLSLRPPVNADLESLFRVYGDPATHHFSPFGPLKNVSQAKVLLDKWIKHWDEKGFGQRVVSMQESPHQIIGFGGIDTRSYLDVEQMNLGYRFAPEA